MTVERVAALAGDELGELFELLAAGRVVHAWLGRHYERGVWVTPGY